MEYYVIVCVTAGALKSRVSTQRQILYTKGHMSQPHYTSLRTPGEKVDLQEERRRTKYTP